MPFSAQHATQTRLGPQFPTNVAVNMSLDPRMRLTRGGNIEQNNVAVNVVRLDTTP